MKIGRACPIRTVRCRPYFQGRGVSIGPLRSRVQSPKSIDLKAIVFQVAIPGTLDQLVPLPTKLNHIQPVIGKEVNVRLQSLCTYSEGTKAAQPHADARRSNALQGHYRHPGPHGVACRGKVPSPVSHIWAGRRGPAPRSWWPATTWTSISRGKSKAGKPPARLNWSLPRVAGRAASGVSGSSNRAGFRSTKSPSLSSVADDPVEPVHAAAYPLHGEQRPGYQIVVHPQLPDVNEVKLHDIPGSIHVLNTEADTGRRTWTFLVDVSVKGRWSRPERLFYDVVTPHERLTGELHIHLKPPRWASGAPTLSSEQRLQVVVHRRPHIFLCKQRINRVAKLAHVFHLEPPRPQSFLFFPEKLRCDPRTLSRGRRIMERAVVRPTPGTSLASPAIGLEFLTPSIRPAHRLYLYPSC